MITSGDNDWTDCDRTNIGGFNSLERSDYERQLLFATPYLLGPKPLPQLVQIEPLRVDGGGVATACVEHQRRTRQPRHARHT